MLRVQLNSISTNIENRLTNTTLNLIKEVKAGSKHLGDEAALLNGEFRDFKTINLESVETTHKKLSSLEKSIVSANVAVVDLQQTTLNNMQKVSSHIGIIQ